MTNRSLGTSFTRLWTAYAVSTFGTCLALDALPLIAIRVLHAEPGAVSALAAAGLAVGVVLAVPLGPWVEYRPKRPVMVATDLLRFAAMLSIPVAFACGVLGYAQLLIVSVVMAAADIAFRAASGAYLKNIVPQEDLLVANGTFESTTWTATALGPPLGGTAIGLFGPVTTVLADACSYLLSAAALGSIRAGEPQPDRGRVARTRAADLFAGWRYLLTHPVLRPLFLNSVAVNGLIMATAPVVAVLMLGSLGFPAWQYGLAFGIPCLAGLLGSRLSPRLVRRYGERRILLVAGSLRACWPIGLAGITAGLGGLMLVIVVEAGLIASIGIFNPVMATSRLRHTESGSVARVLTAWSITGKATTAILTALWGVLAQLTGPRTALAVAGVLLLATPLLLFRGGYDDADRAAEPSQSPTAPEPLRQG
ncbi:MFS transporter [Nocardia aobensis]|uniref:MFS transporter n=1 Tax=Nocardia aobensis TaxID=257277 RepID=UPI00030409DC|nr:MFS transporter [Nocardia aobensis]